jgi:hypothetical protein
VEDFSLDAVGTAVPQGWQKGTGTYEIKELATQDSVLKHLDVGTKYLEATGAGTIAIQSKAAYGTWEFDYYKGDNGSIDLIHLFNTKTDGSGDGYAVRINNSEVLGIYRINAGVTTFKFYTADSYLSANTWYRFKVTRTKDGEMYLYVKGGAFGDSDWTTVVAGGAGTNPFTDATLTAGGYFSPEMTTQVGGIITNIKITEGVQQ